MMTVGDAISLTTKIRWCDRCKIFFNLDNQGGLQTEKNKDETMVFFFCSVPCLKIHNVKK